MSTLCQILLILAVFGFAKSLDGQTLFDDVDDATKTTNQELTGTYSVPVLRRAGQRTVINMDRLLQASNGDKSKEKYAENSNLPGRDDEISFFDGQAEIDRILSMSGSLPDGVSGRQSSDYHKKYNGQNLDHTTIYWYSGKGNQNKDDEDDDWYDRYDKGTPSNGDAEIGKERRYDDDGFYDDRYGSRRSGMSRSKGQIYDDGDGFYDRFGGKRHPGDDDHYGNQYSGGKAGKGVSSKGGHHDYHQNDDYYGAKYGNGKGVSSSKGEIYDDDFYSQYGRSKGHSGNGARSKGGGYQLTDSATFHFGHNPGKGGKGVTSKGGNAMGVASKRQIDFNNDDFYGTSSKGEIRIGNKRPGSKGVNGKGVYHVDDTATYYFDHYQGKGGKGVSSKSGDHDYQRDDQYGNDDVPSTGGHYYEIDEFLERFGKSSRSKGQIDDGGYGKGSTSKGEHRNGHGKGSSSKGEIYNDQYEGKGSSSKGEIYDNGGGKGVSSKGYQHGPSKNHINPSYPYNNGNGKGKGKGKGGPSSKGEIIIIKGDDKRPSGGGDHGRYDSPYGRSSKSKSQGKGRYSKRGGGGMSGHGGYYYGGGGGNGYFYYGGHSGGGYTRSMMMSRSGGGKDSMGYSYNNRGGSGGGRNYYYNHGMMSRSKGGKGGGMMMPGGGGHYYYGHYRGGMMMMGGSKSKGGGGMMMMGHYYYW